MSESLPLEPSDFWADCGELSLCVPVMSGGARKGAVCFGHGVCENRITRIHEHIVG
jgi:hypothetical protein